MNAHVNPVIAGILNTSFKPVNHVRFVPNQIVWSGDHKTYHLLLVDENNPKSAEFPTDEKPVSELETELKKLGSNQYEFCEECGVYCEGRCSEYGFAFNTICQECEELAIEESRDAETLRLLTDRDRI